MLIVSACLAGFPCRYDGVDCQNPLVCELVAQGKAIAICPEQLGGLTTPREPSEIKDNKVISRSGYDVTYQFIKGAEIVLDLAKRYNCKKAILKANSPSCGSNYIYDGTFSKSIVNGDGYTANLLKVNGIEVITEFDL